MISVILSVVAIAISGPLLVYNGYWIFTHLDETRRFLKLMVTGKYESPKEKKQ